MRARDRIGFGAWYILGLLTLINILGIVDRTLPAVLIQPIKRDLGLNDAEFGLINGLAFTLVYCLVALPLSDISDRKSRRRIIAICLLFWSLMTMAGSASRRFSELALARVGLAIGEGGFLPAAHSLLADYFPPERRGFALSVLMAGSSVGVTVGLTAGGALGGALGWRTTMIIVGASGLIITLLFLATTREPKRAAVAQDRRAGFMETLQHLGAQPSFRHLAFGGALYAAFSSATAAFTPGFLIRSFGLSMANAGASFGLVFGIAGVVGILSGGYLGDRLGARDPRWIVWVPAIGLALATPAAVLAFLAHSSTLCLLLLFIPKALGPLYLGTCYALVHRLAGPSRRATSSALLLIAIQGIGSSVGPWFTGQVSDMLAITQGQESLRYALALVSIALLWGSIHFALSGRYLLDDLARSKGL
jgi:predicted MFS family arabinose efflux permease